MRITENKQALTVEKLIDELKKMPQDAKVYTEQYRGMSCDLVKVVKALNIGNRFTKPMVLLSTE